MEAKRFSRDTIDQDQLQAEYTINPDTEEEEGGGGEAEKEKKKKAGPQLPLGRPRGASGSIGCQAERCGADLSDAKKYHRRHKVCEAHSKAPVVLVAGLRQRFCQQCSRFHELSEFDEAKRSCRRRLAGHNERRRKNSIECCGESSSNSKTTSKDHNIYNNIKSDGSDHHDQRPIFHMMTPQGNSTACKQFHIR